VTALPIELRASSFKSFKLISLLFLNSVFILTRKEKYNIYIYILVPKDSQVLEFFFLSSENAGKLSQNQRRALKN